MDKEYIDNLSKRLYEIDSKQDLFYTPVEKKPQNQENNQISYRFNNINNNEENELTDAYGNV